MADDVVKRPDLGAEVEVVAPGLGGVERVIAERGDQGRFIGEVFEDLAGFFFFHLAHHRVIESE